LLSTNTHAGTVQTRANEKALQTRANEKALQTRANKVNKTRVKKIQTEAWIFYFT
jgi:hypothetical protein